MAKAKHKMDFSGISAQEKDSRRTQKSSTSMGGSSSMVFDESVFKGHEIIKFDKDKNYVIKFVPYEVDETHPKVMQGKMKPGQAAYVLDYTQHAIGMNKTMVLCPKGTLGRPCPVCDRFFDLRQEDPKSEEAAAIKSSRRVLYNVVVLKSTDDKVPADLKKVRLLFASQWLFESPMLDELKKGDGEDDDEGGVSEYSVADICVGTDGLDKALKIMTKEVTKDGRTFNEFSFQVVNNKKELDEEALLEDAVPLHKALNPLTPDTLSRMLYGDAEIPSGDDEDEDDEDDEDVPAVKKSSKKVEEEEDEDEEEEKPAPKKKTKAPEPEEEEEEEEEKPAPKKKKKADGCPFGHEFGKDYGYEDDCDECDNCDACEQAKKALKAAAKKKAVDDED